MSIEKRRNDDTLMVYCFDGEKKMYLLLVINFCHAILYPKKVGFEY